MITLPRNTSPKWGIPEIQQSTSSWHFFRKDDHQEGGGFKRNRKNSWTPGSCVSQKFPDVNVMLNWRLVWQTLSRSCVIWKKDLCGRPPQRWLKYNTTTESWWMTRNPRSVPCAQKISSRNQDIPLRLLVFLNDSCLSFCHDESNRQLMIWAIRKVTERFAIITPRALSQEISNLELVMMQHIRHPTGNWNFSDLPLNMRKCRETIRNELSRFLNVQT